MGNDAFIQIDQNDGYVAFNEAGNDWDYRFEGANNTTLFGMNGGQDNIHFGRSAVANTFMAIQAGNQTREVASGTGVAINLEADTYTDSHSATTLADWSLVKLDTPTLVSTNAMTYTVAATLRIDAAPVASTNVTLTNNYALYVADGNVRFSDRVIIDGNNGIFIEDAGKWGFSYGTQGAGWLSIGDTGVFNGVSINPGSVQYTNFPADGTIQPEYQGAVGTPTYSFQDDPNTGMYQSQADYLDFAAGGVKNLTVRTDRVDIPVGLLTLNGARFQKTRTADVTSSSGTVAIGNAWGSAPTVKWVRSYRSESGFTFRLNQIVTYGSTCTVVASYGESHAEVTYSAATGALRAAVSTGTFAFEVLEFYS